MVAAPLAVVRRRSRLHTLLGVSLALLASWAPLALQARPLTVDDILSMEDIGRVEFAPDGRSLFYEWIPPYENAPNVRTLYMQVDRSALAQIRRVDVGSASEPRPAFNQDGRGGYWMGGFSPDGKRLAVYSLINDEVRAGVLDLATDQVRYFDFTPNYYWLVQRAFWISDEELVYPALPAGEQPSIVFRSGIAARIQKQWRKNFEGREPSTTVLHSTPDGLAAADVFRRGSLVRVNARTGQSQAIGDGYYYGFRLSNDGRYLAVLKEGGLIQPLPDIAPNYDAVRRQLVVFDLERRRSARIPCERCNTAPASLQWSADGHRLLFFAASLEGEPRSGRWHVYSAGAEKAQAIDLPGIELACDLYDRPKPGPAALVQGKVAVLGFPVTTSGDESTLTSNCATARRNDWRLLDLENGRAVNLTTGLDSIDRDNPVAVDARGILLLADGALWRMDGYGRRRMVHRSPHGALSIWKANALAEQEAYLGRDRLVGKTVLQTHTTFVMVDVEAGTVMEIQKPRAGRVLALSTRGDSFASRIDDDAGSRLVVVRSQNAVEQTVEDLNHHLAPVSVAKSVTLEYSVDGVALTSCALLPEEISAKRLPMIVNIYPQFIGSCPTFGKSQFYLHNLQLLATQGYVVLFPNVVGAKTPSRGAGAADELVKLALAAVDEAIARGYADPDRIGIYGLSQGYNSALRLLTESARFRTAVLLNGVSNFVSQYGSMPLYTRFGADSHGLGNAGRYEDPTSPNWLGAAPWQDPQSYVRHNPFFRLDRIGAPVLIMHSDFDQFDLGQSEELFSALYRMRKPATYVTYWGEGHGNLSPANVRDSWRRITEWFARYLQPATVPTS